MKWTVLTENTVNKRGLLSEHGLSVLVEVNGKRILFDTGQTDVFLQNASQLNVSLDELDAVVLSHGHYDHCGGLQFLKDQEIPVVYMGKGAAFKKLSRENDGGFREIGIPWSTDFIRAVNVKETDGLHEIFPDVFLLSGIPKLADFEGVSPVFYQMKDELASADLMQDEQLLIMRENGKIHVLAGCCHMGFISCLRYIRKYFPKEDFGTVLAGMHLRNVTCERLNATIEAVKELNPECLIPVHCTGTIAIAQMKLTLGDKCRLAEAGSRILI